MHEFISLRTGGKDKDKHGATTLRGHMEKPEVGKTWKYRQQHRGSDRGLARYANCRSEKCLRAVVYSKTKITTNVRLIAVLKGMVICSSINDPGQIRREDGRTRRSIEKRNHIPLV